MKAATFLGAGGLILGAMVAGAQAQADRPGDREALAALVQSFAKAYDAGDAGAVAGLFAPDARLVDDTGEVIDGRDAIRSRFAAGFQAAPGRAIELSVTSLRFLAADVALAMAEGQVRTSKEDEPSAIRSGITLARRDGRWEVAEVHDLPAAGEAEPDSNYDHLQELEWLVGDWVEEGKNSYVKTSWHWSENKNFLVGTFEMKGDGPDPALSGTQRIGWDPLARQIKSWTFDSNGGYGEGQWVRKGEDEWRVRASGVLRDGQMASATQALAHTGPDRASWSFTDRTAVGEALPDVPPIVIVRQPPKPR